MCDRTDVFTGVGRGDSTGKDSHEHTSPAGLRGHVRRRSNAKFGVAHVARL